MANNSSVAEESLIAPSQGILAAEWGLLGFLALTNLYLTIASAIYQFTSNQRGLKLKNRLCTLSCGLLLLYVAPKVVETTRIYPFAAMCKWVTIPFRICPALSRFFVYLSLWIRQHSVYKSVPSSATWMRLAQKLSLATLIGISIFSLVAIFVLPFSILYHEDNGLCGGNIISISLLIISTIGLTFSQLLLLLLLLLPFCKYFSRLLTDVKSVYVRNACTAAVCIGSDLIMAVFLPFLDHLTKYLSEIFFDLLIFLNFSINATALIFSFPDYKTRLFPFKLLQSIQKTKVIVLSQSVFNGNEIAEHDDSQPPGIINNAWEKDVETSVNTVSAEIVHSKQ